MIVHAFNLSTREAYTDLCDFETTLVYIDSASLARAA